LHETLNRIISFDKSHLSSFRPSLVTAGKLALVAIPFCRKSGSACFSSTWFT